MRKLVEKEVKRVFKESILKSLLLLHLLFNPTEILQKHLPFMLFLIATVKDGPLFFIGGLPFLGLTDNFVIKNNAFQTIF